MWLYRDYGSTPVSRSGHPRLACGLDLPDLALRLAFYWHLASAQVQSWLAGVLLNLFVFASLILMALDAVRFHWSWMPLWLQVIGGSALVVSFVLMSLVFRENSYLSATIRIQEERGQTVITTGPYQYVRHPMYAGGLFMFLGTPLLLGSWYGLLLTMLFLPALIVRAVLEERTLLQELPGYSAYMVQVKYRLIPYVW